MERYNQPTVTVIVVTYNHVKYIEKAVKSILAQTGDFTLQLIIANDFSTDGTTEVIEEVLNCYEGKHIIKHLSHKKNIGMVANFSTAYNLVEGSYIALCDGDDYWTDNLKISKQVSYLNDNPDTVITYHDVSHIDELNSVIKHSGIHPSRKKDFTCNELKEGRWIVTCTMCFRNILGDLPSQLYNVFNVDTFLTSILGQYGAGKYLENIGASHYRIHGEGVWSKETSLYKDFRSLTLNPELMNYYIEKEDLEFVRLHRNKSLNKVQNICLNRLNSFWKIKIIKHLIRYRSNFGYKNTLYWIKQVIIDNA